MHRSWISAATKLFEIFFSPETILVYFDKIKHFVKMENENKKALRKTVRLISFILYRSLYHSKSYCQQLAGFSHQHQNDIRIQIIRSQFHKLPQKI